MSTESMGGDESVEVSGLEKVESYDDLSGLTGHYAEVRNPSYEEPTHTGVLVDTGSEVYLLTRETPNEEVPDELKEHLERDGRNPEDFAGHTRIKPQLIEGSGDTYLVADMLE